MFQLILFTHLSIDSALAHGLPQAGTTQVPLTAEMIRELTAGMLLEAARPFIDGDERRREGCLSVAAPGWPAVLVALEARARAFVAHREALAIEPSARGLYELATMELPVLPPYPPADLGDKAATIRTARAREIVRRLTAKDHALADAIAPTPDLEAWLPWSVRQIRIERAAELVAAREAWIAETTAALEALEAGGEIAACLQPLLTRHEAHGNTPPALCNRWRDALLAVDRAKCERQRFALGVLLRDYGTPDQVARFDLDMLPADEGAAKVREVAFRRLIADGWTICDLHGGSFQTEVPAAIWPSASRMLALVAEIGGTVRWWKSERDDEDGESWSAMVKVPSPLGTGDYSVEEFLLPAAAAS